MSKEDYDTETKEAQALLNQILDLCRGKKEWVVINSLISALVNAGRELEVPSGMLVMAVIEGLKIPMIELKPPEIPHTKMKES